MRICPITGSDKWQHYYTSKTNRIITGDQRISEGKLEKIICTDSGVVVKEDLQVTNLRFYMGKNMS